MKTLAIASFAWYYWFRKLKENELGRTFSMHMEDNKNGLYEILVGKIRNVEAA